MANNPESNHFSATAFTWRTGHALCDSIATFTAIYIPVFHPMQQPPNKSPVPSSKGQIHVKLIQMRGLGLVSFTARPYVVVQFEKNEDVSDDIPEAIFTAVSTSGALSLGTICWKFDVTSEASLITFNVYDRAGSGQGFLGTVAIEPVLIHDHTVDRWYKLLPCGNEVVRGEIRVQVSFEKYRAKPALNPRDFEFLKLIGRSALGRVFQVRKKDTKRLYAMKVLWKKQVVAKKEIAHIISERKILQRSLDSPFLVGLKFSFQTDTELYLLTDFKCGGELFWHLQCETRFSEERARFYIAELVLALEHLHKYDIVYRDLKPENILLDAIGHVALCDFGLSKADLRPDELTTTFCGTTEYLAPEVLLDDGYSKVVDFWSLGVLFFEMCCGWSPFYAEDTQQMYKNICFGKIRFPNNVINADGKQFVKQLLNRNPKHRLGAVRDAEELKEHPFFSSIDWNALARKQVTPPFKPVVGPDESTANFDNIPLEDLKKLGLVEDRHKLDLVTDLHQLGLVGASDSDTQRKDPHGIEIGLRNKREALMGSPLTNSVQENFRGFTYSGGESVQFALLPRRSDAVPPFLIDRPPASVPVRAFNSPSPPPYVRPSTSLPSD